MYSNLRLDLSAMARSTLAGQETEGAVTGGFVLDGTGQSKEFGPTAAAQTLR